MRWLRGLFQRWWDRNGYEEWSDIPRFAGYRLDRWWCATRCRLFGHLPSRESSSCSGMFVQTQDALSGQLVHASSERWREITRYCPRCGRIENTAVLDHRRADWWAEPPTMQWSEEGDPSTW